jgi:hypothetical protein
MTTLTALRRLCLIEGLSLLLLLGVAMPLKYLADQPLAVRYVGLVHGVLWLALEPRPQRRGVRQFGAAIRVPAARPADADVGRSACRHGRSNARRHGP